VGKLRIAFVVTPWFAVPPAGYGGIELMAYNLARELQERGHQVTVICRQGSQGPFETVALAPESWSGDLGTKNHKAREELFLYRAYDFIQRRAFDVVHDHSGLTGILVAAAARPQPPVVATIHGDLTEHEGEFLAAVDHRVHMVAISKAQQALVAGVEWRGAVYNAIDAEVYKPITNRQEKEEYLVTLARISPDKAQHLAIDMAKRLNVRLVLAGKIDRGAEEYFEKEIKPHLGDQITWCENVQGDEKAQLLAKAKAMVFPIQWEEPFGLAMVEAMVSGTPVLAMSRGAATELVEPGITGWLAEDVDGLVEGYERLDEIDLERCVKHASKRFGPVQMADGYQSVYERAIEESFYQDHV
jgi:glycosyltransferase involved in cell wall biosynthesis